MCRSACKYPLCGKARRAPTSHRFTRIRATASSRSISDQRTMLRLIIEDVTLLKGKELVMHIPFRGGATRTLTVPRPVPIWALRRTSPDVVAEIDRLLDAHTDVGDCSRAQRTRLSFEGRKAREHHDGGACPRALSPQTALRAFPPTRAAHPRRDRASPGHFHGDRETVATRRPSARPPGEMERRKDAASGRGRVTRPGRAPAGPGTPAHWRPIHGDYVPWNLREDDRGQLWLLDWEDARWGPPLADLVRYIVAYHSLGWSSADRIATVVRRTVGAESVEALLEVATFWLSHENLQPE